MGTQLRPGYGIRLEEAERLVDTHVPVETLDLEWPAGRVRVSCFLSDVEFPPGIPHRVRCLVTDGRRVLVAWDIHGNADILPGGGAEDGETVAETAHREVLEETGWHIDVDSIRAIGWVHLFSYADPSPDHPFPHPDSFMTVVHAEVSHAEDGHEDWVDIEGFVTRSEFVDVDGLPDVVDNFALSRPYLDAVFDG